MKIQYNPRLIKQIALLLFSVVFAIQSSTTTYAIGPQKFDEVFSSTNNIEWYDPSANCNPDAGSGLVGNGDFSIASYKNPVIDFTAPDPSVIKGENGKYYMYTTGFQQFESKDLVNWKKLNDGINWIKNSPGWTTDRWAPDIAKVGDTYVLSISGRTSGNRTIGYATSNSAAGPFTYKGELLNPADRGAEGMGYDIDPNILTTSDGTYLYYGSGRGYIRVSKLTLKNGKLSAEKSKVAFTSKHPEAPVQAEGPYVYKSGDYYYMYYSVGDWRPGSSTYKLRVARSKKPDGGFEDMNKPLMVSNAAFKSPGHNSVIGDGAGNDYIFYTVFKAGSNKRAVAVDKITYVDGWPQVNNGDGPSSTRQPGYSSKGSDSSAVVTDGSATTSGGGSVTVFGDSLTVGMRNKGKLADKLKKAGWKVQSITAEGGENVAWARKQIATQKVSANLKDSDTVVIAMGTNADTDPKGQVDSIISEIRAINPNIQIYWVNVFAPKMNNYRDAFNTLITNVAGKQNIKIIDWKSEASSRESYYNFSTDELHHTEKGYQRKAAFVTSSIQGGGAPITEDPAVTTTCCGDPSKTSHTTISGSDNAEKAFNFFLSKGYSPQQTAGILGNMKAESAILPMRKQSTSAETLTSSKEAEGISSGWGLVQWTPAGKMIKPSREAGKSYQEIDTLEYQLQFLYEQLEGTGIGKVISEKAAGDHLKQQTTIDGAARSFMLKYERPADQSEAKQVGRVQLANDIFGLYGANSTPGNTELVESPGSGGDCGSSGGSGGGDVVSIAQAEVAKGVRENPLGCDLGNPSRKGSCGPEVDKYTDGTLEYWCADFVSWVYKEAGTPFTGGSSGGWRIPAVSGIQAWFQKNGTWVNNGPGVTPNPGDVYTMGISHTGIVEKVEGGMVHTISGNTSTDNTGNGNGVGRGKYPVGSSEIVGYGRVK